jgi:hypothetical protein
MKGFVKDPGATLDYSFDWGPWLGSDILATSNWVVEVGLTVIPASESFTDTITTLFISGGTDGEEYIITNVVTTNGSRTDERSIEIKVRQR